ncbi:MAG: four helix bundle protein [Saprospiraceae bacterium]|uniref:Four helix bundle protein n=1 Tax=Candidatus Opimibacter skivensis TaxID=2982028 RepID=A0A9D7XN68_9BACT|nr:four helix bundle protein [Candidatus Opimibacter skivensis]
MFLNLNHTKLEVFKTSRALVLNCYKVTKQFPDEEKFGIISQIRRAGLSIHLNIAEGASRRSKTERQRYFEIARGSVIEVDTAFDIALALNYCNESGLQVTGILIVDTFKMLTGLMK